MTEALAKAAEIAGGNKGLAGFLGVHPSFISQLITGHRKLPVKYCRLIADEYGISREDLRPDVFGAAPKSRKKAG